MQGQPFGQLVWWEQQWSVFGVTGIVGATGIGCAGCAGLAGAGCGMEIWDLAGACGVAVVASGAVSAGLTLHSHQCHLMKW